MTQALRDNPSLSITDSFYDSLISFDSFEPEYDQTDQGRPQQPRNTLSTPQQGPPYPLVPGGDTVMKLEDVEYDSSRISGLLEAVPPLADPALALCSADVLDPSFVTEASPDTFPIDPRVEGAAVIDPFLDNKSTISVSSKAFAASSPESGSASAGKSRKRIAKKKKRTKTVTVLGATAKARSTTAMLQTHPKAAPQGKEEDKRDKFLERNRIAASKCRQKRKEWMLDLEEKKQEAENTHWQLQHEFQLLVSEVSRLKNMLMEHAHCHDGNVEKWIEVEARRIVGVSGDELVHIADGDGDGDGDGRGDPAFIMERGSSAGSVDGSGCGSGFESRRRDSIAQQSSATSWDTPTPKEAEVNYDHMPDDMFLEDRV